MKKVLILGLIAILLSNCSLQEETSVNYVIQKFNENSVKIQKIEFSAQRIDTFAHNGTVWNNTGIALIEKDEGDKVFGFSFYGKRDDIPKEYIYQDGMLFEISANDNSYKTETGGFAVLGKPGGQMIPQNLLYLDSIYSSITLSENDKNYIIRFEFEDDSIYNVKDIVKIVQLEKDSFLPWRITRTSTVSGSKTCSQITLTNIKINNDVENSIKDIFSRISKYKVVQPEQHEANKLLFNEVPNIKLTQLLNQDEVVELQIKKLTLIDFWEVWCGPCKASLPKVQKLQNELGSDLEVVGIVSDDKESAIQFLEEKGITFLNLVGHKDLEKIFSVDSWPRYFLVDKNGIVQKEYFGYSEQIALDINQILGK